MQKESQNPSNTFIAVNTAKNDKEMVVYITSGYQKEIINNKKIVNHNFELGEKIGQGSFWSVRKVRRNLISSNGILLDNNYYVFKKGQLNKKTCAFDDDDLEGEWRIGLKEYNILKTICHPNISRLYECIIDNKKDKIVFVMEYCDLGCLMKVEYNEEDDQCYIYNKKVMDYLWTKFKKKDVPDKYSYSIQDQKDFLETITLDIIKQLTKSLLYLHNEKLVAHLDIKPDNILIKTPNNGDDNYVKLSDFSISKKFNNKNEMISFFGGTPLYEPPERETETLTNPFLSDIFSFGKSMFSFLFCTIDFDNMSELKKQINNCTLLNFFEHTMEEDPQKRFDINKISDLLNI